MVKARLRVRETDEMSKTDMIASMFTRDPLKVLTPKEISTALGIDLRIVTSIVNRLRDEGTVERIGWGRYRLKTGMVIDEKAVGQMIDDMIAMSSHVLGSVESAPDGADALTRMVYLYERMRLMGGEPFALNILRICAKRRLDDEGVRTMLRIVSEAG